MNAAVLHWRQGRGIIAATVLGSGMAFLDGSVVNVALPALQQAFSASIAGLQWALDAYLLTLAALLLVGGALGDKFGRRRIFDLGVIAFTLASILCGFAPSMRFLVVARGIQGVGGALLVPGSLAMMRSAFVERDQNAAIAWWSGLAGVSTALGPLVGGWLITHWSWRGIFFLNVPLAAATLFFSRRFVPESKASATTRLDIAGAALATLFLLATVYALIEGPRTRWALPAVVSFAAGIVLFAFFLWVEQRRPHAMLPLPLFRSRRFTVTNIATLAIYFALSGTMFFVVVQLQRVADYSPLKAGAALFPVTILMTFLSPVAGRVGSRIGPAVPMATGAAVSALGMFMLRNLTSEVHYFSDVFPGMVVFGLGLATLVAPLTAAVLASVPVESAGIASGVNNAVSRVAGLLAIAILPPLSGFDLSLNMSAQAYSRGLLLCAGAALIGSLASLAVGLDGYRRYLRWPSHDDC